MQRDNTKVSDPGGIGGEVILVWVFVIVSIFGTGTIYAALHLGHSFAETGEEVPTDPFKTLFGFLGGDIPWPGTVGWLVVGAVVAVLVLLSLFVWLVVKGGKGKRTRVDRAAGKLGTGADVASLQRKEALKKAKRLGTDKPGVPIGRHLATGAMLFGSWEDMHIDIWGPRTGKTTSRAVPAILVAPGAVLVTSNKRDVLDAVRGPRTEVGRVWVFDPQQLADEPPQWWWNPLTYVTDEVQAAKLAANFASGSREAGARTDAYFDPAGQDLLAGLLLAAALDNRPITDVYRWLTRPTDDTAVGILEAHDYPLTADQVAGVISAPDKQRGGIYGTAQQMASCLTNRQVVQWVTPSNDPSREQFDPHRFIVSTDTLVSLSKEGRGTAGPLVTALTVAVCEAAEQIGAQSPGGRLRTPLLGVLDEAANVCRWKDLPDLYSHFGSRGIVLMTILQSWSQGVEVWGAGGMKKLWSASNIKVYGGGVDERSFLEDMAHVIGNYERIQSSASITPRQGRTVSRQVQKELIMEVSDLAAMPRGRALVFSSGNRPTLIRTVPWMEGPHAKAVEASIAANDPAAQQAAQGSYSAVGQLERGTKGVTRL